MKQWVLPSFSLDLRSLWTHSEGPRVEGMESEISQRVWKMFKDRRQRQSIGFYDLPNRIELNELNAWKTKAETLRKNFDGAVILGIGGSYLGAEAILRALRTPEDAENFPLYWITQPDPQSIERVKKLAEHKKLATVVISKSGNTTETLSAFYHLSHHLKPEGYVIVTDLKSGKLRLYANANGWSTFPVPQDIGGRFSVLCAVGLFPAFLGGVDAVKILEGAKRVENFFAKSDSEECPAFWMAYSHYLWDTRFKKSIHYFMPYLENLRPLADWHTQLFGESLGKIAGGSKCVGFTPVTAVGSTDQHSLLQLLKEGPKNKMVGFLDVTSKPSLKVGPPAFSARDVGALATVTFEELSHFACTATAQTLINSGVPTYRVGIEHLAPETLGGLLFFFETVCALCGELYEIDAFGQPSVEEGKRMLIALVEGVSSRMPLVL